MDHEHSKEFFLGEVNVEQLLVLEIFNTQKKCTAFLHTSLLHERIV